MRIEIDHNLEKTLDEIKNKERSIYGRGHTDTVRFLVRYYETHKGIQELEREIKQRVSEFLSGLDKNLEASLEKVILRALGRVIQIILSQADPLALTLSDEKQPETRQPADLERGRRVR